MNGMKEYSTTSQVVVEDEKMVPNAYPGQRTQGTQNTQTRVRVSSHCRSSSIHAVLTSVAEALQLYPDILLRVDLHVELGNDGSVPLDL